MVSLSSYIHGWGVSSRPKVNIINTISNSSGHTQFQYLLALKAIKWSSLQQDLCGLPQLGLSSIVPSIKKLFQLLTMLLTLHLSFERFGNTPNNQHNKPLYFFHNPSVAVIKSCLCCDLLLL